MERRLYKFVARIETSPVFLEAVWCPWNYGVNIWRKAGLGTYHPASDTNHGHASARRLDRSRPDTLNDIHYVHPECQLDMRASRDTYIDNTVKPVAHES